MLWKDSLRVALQNLWGSKLRSFLTLLGILIAVATLVTVVSIIRGMDRFISERASQLGSDVFIISRFGIITNVKQWAQAQKRPDLTLEDYQALRQGMGAGALVGATVRQGGEVKRRGETLQATARGVTANMIDIRTEEMVAGRFVSEADDRHRRQTAVIGQEVLTRLFPGGHALGQELYIQGARFLVVGVAAPVGSTFGHASDNFVYIPLSTALKLFGRRRSLSFQIRVRDPAWMAAAEDQARLTLRTRHHLGYSEEDDFGLVSPAAVLELWQELTGTIAKVAVVVTAVFVVMGGFVIMNIMLASVTERTWEVGMRKTVGATSADVKRQFLMEAICLSTAGGALGVVVSVAATQAVAWLSPVPAPVALDTVAGALAVSSAAGLFFGIYPASRAARMDPIEALRAGEN